MAKLTRRLVQDRDAMRRYGQRGVARAVLENAGNEHYFETHEIAEDYRRSYSTKKLERLATERNPVGNTGMVMFGMATARHPKAATWP